MGDRYRKPRYHDRDRDYQNYMPPERPPTPPWARRGYDDHHRVQEEYTFRGAASHGSNDYNYNSRAYDHGMTQPANREPLDRRRPAYDDYRPANDRMQPVPRDYEFSFRAPGTAAPRYPADFHPLPPPPPPRRDVRRNGTQRLDNHSNRNTGRDGGPKYGYQNRRPPPGASARDLLHTQREKTPEQLSGMSGEGESRFREIDFDNADLNATVQEERAQKRTKTDESGAHVSKWSNPDPYSSLPPTLDNEAPKKDLVELIRLAKVQSTTGAGPNVLRADGDFISFEPDVTDEEQAVLRPLPQHTKRGRKRALANTIDAGDIVDDWQISFSNPTPWFQCRSPVPVDAGLQCALAPSTSLTTDLTLNRLHEEIIQFFNFVKPTSGSDAVRMEVVQSIERAIRSIHSPDPNLQYRKVQLNSFGSFAQGVYLPTADMDLVAFSNSRRRVGQTREQLDRIYTHLKVQRLVKPGSGCVISKAKVPLIKFTHLKSGLKCDISFENETGIVAIDTVKRWYRQFPDAAPLVLLVKQFLAMRNMNEVFSGGLGGYSIICLVISMLASRPDARTQRDDSPPNYGHLLLDFFDLYGNKFNYRDTGIDMGLLTYFPKRPFLQQKIANPAKIREKQLVILDPDRSSNNISGGSSQIQQVFDCFKGAHARLQKRLQECQHEHSSHESILECIIGGNYTSFDEQLGRNKEWYNSMYGSASSQGPSTEYPPNQYLPSGHENPGNHPDATNSSLDKSMGKSNRRTGKNSKSAGVKKKKRVRAKKAKNQ